MEELIHKLGIDPKILIAQVVNFLILFGVLWKVLYKPVQTLMSERSERIRKGLENAETIAQQKKEWERERAELLSNAQRETQDMLKRSEERAKVYEQEMKTRTQEEVKKFVDQSKVAMKREHEHAMHELEGHMVEMVAVVAERLFEKKMTAAHDEQLIKAIVKDVAKSS